MTTTTYLVSGITLQGLGIDEKGASLLEGCSIQFLSVAEDIEGLTYSIC